MNNDASDAWAVVAVLGTFVVLGGLAASAYAVLVARESAAAGAAATEATDDGLGSFLGTLIGLIL